MNTENTTQTTQTDQTAQTINLEVPQLIEAEFTLRMQEELPYTGNFTQTYRNEESIKDPFWEVSRKIKFQLAPEDSPTLMAYLKSQLVRNLGIEIRVLAGDKADRVMEKEALLKELLQGDGTVEVGSFFAPKTGRRRSTKASPEQVISSVTDQAQLEKLLAMVQAQIAANKAAEMEAIRIQEARMAARLAEVRQDPQSQNDE